MASERPVSSLVLAELYDSGDASFLDHLRRHRGNFKPFLGLIEKWKKDQRPWARRLKIQFILDNLMPPESRVAFKRILKQAWADRDDEIMGVFMVALDRSIRRKRAKRYRHRAATISTNEELRVPSNILWHGFSIATRHYMRRRAWRYFRKLGFADGPAYISALSQSLARYTDDDMRAGENLLDNWGLMHACFGKSAVLAFSARHTNLSTAGRLQDLQAAPMFERHWTVPDAFAVLIKLLLDSNCRPVRVWAIQLLKRLHADRLPSIQVDALLKLIDHDDADVAAFAADILDNARTVAAFPMTTWMGLLATRNPAVVAIICRAFLKHVSFDRVTLAQSVELATRAATPVSRLGLDILASKTIRSDADHRTLAALAAARCGALGSEIAAFALKRLNVANQYRLDEVTAFFDSRLKSMRNGAFVALADQSPANVDPAFWARLFESPYDDVRIELVNRLNRRLNLPGASAQSTATLWQSVLLNIHRGGRAKLSALRQISDRIMREPQSAAALLPVLVIAIRSVRGPEARHGLAAIVSAVERVPALSDLVRQQLPELQLDETGVAR